MQIVTAVPLATTYFTKSVHVILVFYRSLEIKLSQSDIVQCLNDTESQNMVMPFHALPNSGHVFCRVHQPIMFTCTQADCFLQVNRSPSFGTDEQLDYDIKSAVIEDALRLIHIRFACFVIF